MTHTLLARQPQSSSRPRITREISLAVLLAAFIFMPGAILARAQVAQAAQAAQAAQGPAAVGTDLVASLKATPGVLGIEAARTQGGKQVLFVWFENKQAVLKWFYSDAHQALMQTFTPGAATGRTPLADIADDSGPIMTIASITYADAAQVQGVKLPISQIAIELYAPLPGGLAAGGRFAPSSVKVKGLLETPGK